MRWWYAFLSFREWTPLTPSPGVNSRHRATLMGVNLGCASLAALTLIKDSLITGEKIHKQLISRYVGKSILLPNVSGAVYTTAWARPMHDLAQTGCQLLLRHLQCGPALNKKSDVIIAPKCTICQLYLFQTTALCSRRQMTYGRMWAELGPRPCCQFRPSAAHIHPGMTRRKYSTLLLAWKFSPVYMAQWYMVMTKTVKKESVHYFVCVCSCCFCCLIMKHDLAAGLSQLAYYVPGRAS